MSEPKMYGGDVAWRGESLEVGMTLSTALSAEYRVVLGVWGRYRGVAVEEDGLFVAQAVSSFVHPTGGGGGAQARLDSSTYTRHTSGCAIRRSGS
jgi:hypothetical protein